MKKIGIIAAISFLAGVIFFALTFGFFHKTGAPTGQEQHKFLPTLAQPVAKAESIELKDNGFSFAPLVKKVRAAVVKVTSESMQRRPHSFFNDDFFGAFHRGLGIE